MKSRFSIESLLLRPMFDGEDTDGSSEGSSDFEFIGEGADESEDEDDEEDVDPEDSVGPDISDEIEDAAEEKRTKKVSKPVKVEDEEEVVEEASTEEVEPEPEEEEIEEEKVNGRTSLKAIKAKYPTIFKDFPDLRDAFFREREFSKVYGSVDDAVEAATKSGYYDSFVSAVDKGDVGMLMDAVIEMGDSQAQAFVENFLPAVEARSTKALGKITAPFVHRAIRFVFEDGKNMGGERGQNLMVAARYMAKHLFNEENPERLHGQLQAEPSPERQELENQRRQFATQQFEVASSDVERVIDNRLQRDVIKHIDPNGAMNEFMREALAEKVIKELQDVIVEDKAHLTRMTSLWRRATKEAYNGESKARIVSAFLARAKQSMPSVVARIKAQAKPAIQRAVQEKGDIPSQRSKSGGHSPRPGARIDYSRTTDMDILNGKVTYAETRRK